MYRSTGVWALVLALVLLGMADSTRAQPVDIPATWGGDFWSRPRLTGSWGGLRDELGKKGVVLESTCCRRSRAWPVVGGTTSRPRMVE